VPTDLLVKFQPIFYSDAINAIFKALGVEWKRRHWNEKI
jgi:predicted ATP-dependent Lon-type protease